MGKKDIWGSKVKNEIRQRIINGLQSGKPRQQILEELSEEYMDKQVLANMISSTLPPEDVPGFTKINNLLFGLIVSFGVYHILLNILGILTKNIESHKKWLLIPFALILPALIFCCGYLIKKVEGSIYTFIIISGLVTTIDFISKDRFSTVFHVIYFIPHILWVLAIIIIANTISKRYFPHLRWKTCSPDKNGKYILGKEDMGK